ncbi:unnamed protein product [Polarella glacialis]|uniref:Uncharacterized protein n=1 Tax=Polarella glacialis TaxID=89957 RepID=A0A813JS05_POLGL|nr:unnamed protein product [Polarella glacialis]
MAEQCYHEDRMPRALLDLHELVLADFHTSLLQRTSSAASLTSVAFSARKEARCSLPQMKSTTFQASAVAHVARQIRVHHRNNIDQTDTRSESNGNCRIRLMKACCCCHSKEVACSGQPFSPGCLFRAPALLHPVLLGFR